MFVPHRKHNTSPLCSQELWPPDHRGVLKNRKATSNPRKTFFWTIYRNSESRPFILFSCWGLSALGLSPLRYGRLPFNAVRNSESSSNRFLCERRNEGYEITQNTFGRLHRNLFKRFQFFRAVTWKDFKNRRNIYYWLRHDSRKFHSFPHCS
jgi:hypothetical protein